MKKIFLLLAFVLFSFFSETFGQVKGTAPGLFNTIADLQATTPVLSYGSELAYVLEDKSMWRYDRTDEEWQRQVYIDFGVGLPSGDPGTAPKLYMNITNGDLYQWDSSGSQWVAATGGTDDQVASEVAFTPTGDILSSDLQSVCVEIQTQLSAVQAALGITNGAQGFGSFTGSTLSDNETAKVLFQELETAVERSLNVPDASIPISKITPNISNLIPERERYIVSSTPFNIDFENGRSQVAQMDLTSAPSPLTLTVSNPIDVGFYTFQFLSVTSNDIVFPANFYNADETSLGTVTFTASDFITCLFDGANFYCK